MSELNATEQKALKIADIAARLVQASVGTDITSMEAVLTKFGAAYTHVKRHVNYEVSK